MRGSWVAAAAVQLGLAWLLVRLRRLPRVSELWLFPVKSCAGARVPRLQVGPSCCRWDRQWAVISLQDGLIQTVRAVPALARVLATVQREQWLVLSADGRPQLRLAVEPATGCPQIRVTKPGAVTTHSTGLLYPESTEWLRQAVAGGLGLVKLHPAAAGRPMRAQKAGVGARLEDCCRGFQDWAPCHLVARSSLRVVNRQLAGAGRLGVPVERFRANIVIEGTAPFEEERWAALSVGQASLRGLLGTPRCVVPTYGADGTQPDGSNPTAMLRKTRMQPDRVKPTYGPFAAVGPIFGVWLAVDSPGGAVCVGDPVTALERSEAQPLFEHWRLVNEDLPMPPQMLASTCYPHRYKADDTTRSKAADADT